MSEPQVKAAIVAAIASIIVAFITVIWNFVATKRIERYKTELTVQQKKFETTLYKQQEELKAQLNEKQAERDARRDYEYEARKRLYEQYEPLLFQLVELSENALGRIQSLARTARSREIKSDGSGWLSENTYYFRSTLYRLVAPLAILKLMQKRLTFVDLSLDPQIETQYMIAKHLFLVMSNDFKLARSEPIIDYDPHDVESQKLILIDPKKYTKQGIFIGHLDNLVESLLDNSSSKPTYLISFGEFEVGFNDSKSNIHKHFSILARVFTDFHPKSRPILWRILITQAHMYSALIRGSQNKITIPKGEFMEVFTIQHDERSLYEWRTNPAEASDNDVLLEPFEIAENYLRSNFHSLPIQKRN